MLVLVSSELFNVVSEERDECSAEQSHLPTGLEMEAGFVTCLISKPLVSAILRSEMSCGLTFVSKFVRT